MNSSRESRQSSRQAMADTDDAPQARADGGCPPAADPPLHAASWAGDLYTVKACLAENPDRVVRSVLKCDRELTFCNVMHDLRLVTRRSRRVRTATRRCILQHRLDTWSS